MDPYLTALYQIVEVGQNTNSYKFALWRALARLAPAKSVISKLDLAPLLCLHDGRIGAARPGACNRARPESCLFMTLDGHCARLESLAQRATSPRGCINRERSNR
jgi:hypothetical protein